LSAGVNITRWEKTLLATPEGSYHLPILHSFLQIVDDMTCYHEIDVDNPVVYGIINGLCSVGFVRAFTIEK
jgi:hypothetical protein